MVPDDFHDFLVASAGVSGALVGLLFVASAIAPERIVARNAPAQAQETAAGAYAVLSNTLFIALAGLYPGQALKYVAVILPVTALVATTGYALQSWFHRAEGWIGFRWWLRRATTVFFLVSQLVAGIAMWRQGINADTVANVVVWSFAFYAIGLTRAWELLGAHDQGFVDTYLLWREQRAAKAQGKVSEDNADPEQTSAGDVK